MDRVRERILLTIKRWARYVVFEEFSQPKREPGEPSEKLLATPFFFGHRKN